MKRRIIPGALALCAVLVGIGLGSSGCTTTKTVTTTVTLPPETVTVTATFPPSTGTATATVTEEPTSSGSFEPILITGIDDKESEPFAVTADKWAIDWAYTPEGDAAAIFSLFVYAAGTAGNDYLEFIVFPSATTGIMNIPAGAGDYYIKVICGGISSWTLTVKPA